MRLITQGLRAASAAGFQYSDIPAQLLRINSVEGSLGFSGAVLTSATDVSTAAQTVTVTGSPVYTASDSGLNNKPSFNLVASGSIGVVAPNVNRASIRFVASVWYRDSTSGRMIHDGTVVSNRFFSSFNIDGNVQNSYGSYLAAATLEPTVGRKRCLFPNDGVTVGKLNDITLSALPVGSASGNGLRIGESYVNTSFGARVGFIMFCSAVPDATTRAALEAKLIQDFG